MFGDNSNISDRSIDPRLLKLYLSNNQDITRMGTCKNHRGEQARFLCQKYNYFLCDKCLRCYDPEIYCKFRSACIINYKDKGDGKQIDRKNE